jgi:NitT/TauT family transport system permease protein
LKTAAYLKRHPNILRVGAVVIFFIAWEYFGRDVNPLFLSYPTAIGRAFVTITESGELQRAFMASMVPFSIGLVISIVLGMIIGVATAHLWWLDYILEPFLSALYAIPRVALVPLIILWAGLETAGKVTILVSVAVFPVIVNTYAGIKDVRGAMLDIGRVYCATPSQIFWKITLPASMPYVLAGIRLSVGLAIIGMVVAEFFTAITGLGGLIVYFANAFATAKLFVPIIVIGLLGIISNEAISVLERYLLAWRDSEKSRN